MIDAAVDVLAIAVYALTLCLSDMAWVITGFNVAIRSVYDKLDPVTIMISAMQISDTCDNMRVRVDGATAYILCAFLFCVAQMSRTESFLKRSCREKRACVSLMFTVALSTRGNVSNRVLFNTTRASLYMLLCRATDQTASQWDTQARACWCLSAYVYPMLFVALVQLALDAESYVITLEKKPPGKKKVIETWDVSAV